LIATGVEELWIAYWGCWFLVNPLGKKYKRRQLCVCNGCRIKQPALIAFCSSGLVRGVDDDGIALALVGGSGAKFNPAAFPEA